MSQAAIHDLRQNPARLCFSRCVWYVTVLCIEVSQIELARHCGVEVQTAVLDIAFSCDFAGDLYRSLKIKF